MAGTTGIRQRLPREEPDGSMVLIGGTVALAAGVAVRKHLSAAAWRSRRRMSRQLARFRPARTAVGAVDSATTWRIATPDDLGSAGSSFGRICIVDAVSVLGILWEPLRATLGELPCGATSAVLADAGTPPVLVRRVKDGEHSWPVMQEGKS